MMANLNAMFFIYSPCRAFYTIATFRGKVHRQSRFCSNMLQAGGKPDERFLGISHFKV
jgi:hypothetical protein